MTQQHPLRISSDLSLPIDAVTQTFAIIAKKRRGKTYTASVLAEEMVKAKLPFVVIDPTGAWWGLRASADGKHAGYPVTIIGGEHGDIPLERGAGTVIADLVVDHPGHYVLDLSLLDSNAAQDQFATDFAERLYRRKATARFPMMLFVDEGDAVIPQQPMPGQQRMLGAYDTLVRRGGIRGLGVCIITQRPAVVNKNVLSQVECLILLQLVGAADQEAVERWVRAHDTAGKAKEFMASLASLGLGEAWVWSPAWLNKFVRIQVRKRETFNSSKTPEVGEHAIEPKVLAPVDIEAIRTKVADTIEKAKADDPKALRVKIAELERGNTELQKRLLSAKPAPPAKETRVEVPILKPADISRIEHASSRAEKAAVDLRDAYNALDRTIQTALVKWHSGQIRYRDPKRYPGEAEAHAHIQRGASDHMALLVRKNGHQQTEQSSKSMIVPAEVLAPAQQRILNAAAFAERIWPSQAPTRAQVALICGYAPSSGSFNNNIGKLGTAGLLISSSGRIRLTEAGAAHAEAGAAPQTAEEVQALVLGKMEPAKQKLLRAVLAAYPGALTRRSLAEATGYAPDSGSYNNNLGAMGTFGVLEIPEKGCVRASPALFLEAR